MYTEFYGLKRKPFQVTADPSFLWLGPKHKEALAVLVYGVSENKGFLLLTGDVGTGKTTLVHALMNRVEGDVEIAKISDPGLSREDFYSIVSSQFGFADEIESKSHFIECFTSFLLTAYENDKKVLLIIDESQRMTGDLLEEIRLLSNIEKQDAKLLTILFVGQNEFNTLLLQPENRALRNRVAITYNIDPLNEQEIGEYINFRLKTAGLEENIFSLDAVEAVYEFSLGLPRQINIICDLAMVFGFEASRRSISKALVEECRGCISFPVQPEATPIIKEDKEPVKKPIEQKKNPLSGIGYFREIAIAALLLIFIGVTGYLFLPGRQNTPLNVSAPAEKTATLHVEPKDKTVDADTIGGMATDTPYPMESRETLEVSYEMEVHTDAPVAFSPDVPEIVVPSMLPPDHDEEVSRLENDEKEALKVSKTDSDDAVADAIATPLPDQGEKKSSLLDHEKEAPQISKDDSDNVVATALTKPGPDQVENKSTMVDHEKEKLQVSKTDSNDGVATAVAKPFPDQAEKKSAIENYEKEKLQVSKIDSNDGVAATLSKPVPDQVENKSTMVEHEKGKLQVSKTDSNDGVATAVANPAPDQTEKKSILENYEKEKLQVSKIDSDNDVATALSEPLPGQDEKKLNLEITEKEKRQVVDLDPAEHPIVIEDKNLTSEGEEKIHKNTVSSEEENVQEGVTGVPVAENDKTNTKAVEEIQLQDTKTKNIVIHPTEDAHKKSPDPSDAIDWLLKRNQ